MEAVPALSEGRRNNFTTAFARLAPLLAWHHLYRTTIYPESPEAGQILRNALTQPASWDAPV